MAKNLENKRNIDPVTGEDLTGITSVLCGLATGMSTISFILNPIAVYLWLIDTLKTTAKNTNGSFLILGFCALNIIASLAASIVAKVWNPKSKWAVVNIVYISITLVISALITWAFIALIMKLASY